MCGLLYHEMAEAQGIVSCKEDPSKLPVPKGFELPANAPGAVRKALYFHVASGFAAENEYYKFKQKPWRRGIEGRRGNTRVIPYGGIQLEYDPAPILKPKIVRTPGKK